MISNIFQWRPIVVQAGEGGGEETTDAYCTLAELRASPDLKLASGETTDDTLLQDLIDAVKALIDSHTGRTFACSADTTRHFDPTCDVWRGWLMLEDDLCAITEIVNGDSVAVTAGEYATRPADLLAITNANYVPYWALKLTSSSGKSWTYETDSDGALAVTGRWAWSTTAPADINRANILGAAHLYRQALSSEGDRPIIAGGGVIIQPAQMPASFWTLLSRYVRKV